MKKIVLILSMILCTLLLPSCKMLQKAAGGMSNNAQGTPYELLVVCDHSLWTSPMGEHLNQILTAPVAHVRNIEPIFNVLRINREGYKDFIAAHRNILDIRLSPQAKQAAVIVRYNVVSQPQIILTLQGPSKEALDTYVLEHGEEIVKAFENAERDRALLNYRKFHEPQIEKAIYQNFGVKMAVPKGYFLANFQPDFIWARYEYPKASQGFMVYTTPYTGKESLSQEALLKARNLYARRIPGAREGTYMTTGMTYPPTMRMFRLEGRLWCEMRGYWDVEGDFMGGPFVSYSTVDLTTNKVFTLDCYVYSPDLPKRNYLRGVEHLLYEIHLPEVKK